jgi:hypothetical protein
MQFGTTANIQKVHVPAWTSFKDSWKYSSSCSRMDSLQVLSYVQRNQAQIIALFYMMLDALFKLSTCILWSKVSWAIYVTIGGSLPFMLNYLFICTKFELCGVLDNFYMHAIFILKFWSLNCYVWNHHFQHGSLLWFRNIYVWILVVWYKGYIWRIGWNTREKEIGDEI